jgi:hypothetical protein
MTKKSQSFVFANLSNTQTEKDKNDKIIREMKLKVDCLQERVENLRNMIWWIKQHLRFCYRKLALLPLRLHDLLKQLIWFYVENTLLQRVRSHSERRIAVMSNIVSKNLVKKEKEKQKQKELEAAAEEKKKEGKEGGSESAGEKKKKKVKIVEESSEAITSGRQPETPDLFPTLDVNNDFLSLPKDWLVNQISNIINQLIALDVSQESILKEEYNKLESDYYEVISFDSLLEELITSLHNNNQILGEKVPLEVALIQLMYGSEEALRYNESLVILKNKQKQLINGSIDAIKVALQSKYDEQERNNLLKYSFPNDSPDISIEEMKNITCVLIDTFDSHKGMLSCSFLWLNILISLCFLFPFFSIFLFHILLLIVILLIFFFLFLSCHCYSACGIIFVLLLCSL